MKICNKAVTLEDIYYDNSYEEYVIEANGWGFIGFKDFEEYLDEIE